MVNRPLSETHPELAKEWHPTKNGDLKPNAVSAGSGKKVWWYLPYDDQNTGKHFAFEWEATVSNRVNGRGCPYLSKPAKAIWSGFNDLGTTNPELLDEWDYDKNDILPSDVTAGSVKKVWWRKKYYDERRKEFIFLEWEATIANRVNGRGCPYISESNKAVLQGFNDLATTHPELAEEWNYEKNTLSPVEVTIGCNKRVWWRLPYDDPKTGKHFVFEWEATINNRHKRGCPFLSTPPKVVHVGFNDLATTHPELIGEWDYERNTISPIEVSFGSNKKVWWKCANGHNWEAVINSRQTGAQCPYCKNVSVLSGHNDLASKYPDVAAEWDYSKNSSSPEGVLFSSPSSVWWKCSKCGNEWKTSIRHRTLNHSGCPKCSSEHKTSFGEQAIFFYIKRIFPDAKNRYLFDGKREIDIFIPVLNIGIEYDGYYFHQNRKRQDFKKKSDLTNLGIRLYRVTEFQKTRELSVEDDTIAYCSRIPGELDKVIIELLHLLNVKMIDVDTEKDYANICESYLTIIKNNSLVTDVLINEWNYEKNKGINPQYISLGSTKKVWWICSSGHEWRATVGSRKDGNGCPICAGKELVVGENDFISLFPELLVEWDYEKNCIKPESLIAGSGKSVWWKCSKCGNSWKTRLVERTTNGKGCSKCAAKVRGTLLTQKLIDEKGSIVNTHPYLLEEWDYYKNEGLTPESVYAGSHRKVWWKCKTCGHQWEVAIRNRANMGRGCPMCRKRKK